VCVVCVCVCVRCVCVCGVCVMLSRSFLLSMGIVSDKKCGENRKSHFVFSNFLLMDNRAVCEIMWKKYCRVGQATDGNMAHAYCVL